MAFCRDPSCSQAFVMCRTCRTQQGAEKNTPKDDEPSAKIPQQSLDAIRQLEQEIERHSQVIECHSQAIVGLKGQINAYLPISSLPVEILCRIFHFTRETHTEHLVGDIHLHGGVRVYGGLQAKELAWVTVTHVCHRWRDAAVNEPSLWTHPTFLYKEWMNAMLERSRTASLAIRVDNTYLKDASNVASAIVRHISHIAQLVVALRTPPGFLQNLVGALSSIEAPQLVHLSLRLRDTEYYSPSGDNEYIEPHTREKLNKDSLPRTAFLGAVKLRHLELSAININWNSHLFSDLTTLVLEYISYKSRPSILQFRSMLARMPNLKSLTLRKALPMTLREGRAKFTCDKRIPLLSLENLVIDAEATEHEFFFNNVALSECLKSIEGRAVYEANSELAFSNLVSAAEKASAIENVERTTTSMYIGGRLADKNRPMLLSLNIKTTQSFAEFVHTGARSYNDHWSGRRDDNPSTLRFQVYKQQREHLHRERTCDELISSICNGINWMNLCELDLYDLWVGMGVTRFPETLARTFGTLPNIRTVIVGPHSANTFLEALLIGPDQDPTHSPTSIAFPGLRHLKMWYVAFDPDFTYHGIRELQAGIYAVDIDNLQDCLMSRYERGAEINKLTLRLCRCIREEKVRKLSEIVVDVDWDEETFGYSDDEEDDIDSDDMLLIGGFDF